MEPVQSLEIPNTEGVKYVGSKLKLLPNILELVDKTNAETIFDAFAGTTRVSQALAQSGYRVISSDSAVWSEVFGNCYLKNDRSSGFYAEIIDHLNGLPEKHGWFSDHYGGLPNGGNSNEDGLKKPFQIHNTRMLDAIRDEIDTLGLGEIEKSVVLTSLILALDKVDSTLGHHVSYLKEWSPRSYKKLKLKVPRLFDTEKEHEVFCGDVFDLVENVEADLAYFDPPYGSNNEKMPPSRVRYTSYYHLWTTVVLHDKPETFGKAKRRVDSRDTDSASLFEEFKRDAAGNFIAVDALRKLVKRTRAKYILLSYSSGGKATARNLREILEDSGKIIEFVKVDYQRNVMASMRWTNDWIREVEKPNQEYLFLIEKG